MSTNKKKKWKKIHYKCLVIAVSLSFIIGAAFGTFMTIQSGCEMAAIEMMYENN